MPLETIHHCPDCEAVLPAGSLFCAHCGASQEQAVARAAEKRRREEDDRKRAEAVERQAAEHRRHEEELRRQIEEAGKQAEEAARRQEARYRAQAEAFAAEMRRGAGQAEELPPNQQQPSPPKEEIRTAPAAPVTRKKVSNDARRPTTQPQFRQLDRLSARGRRTMLALIAVSVLAGIAASLASYLALRRASQSRIPIIESFAASPLSVHPGEGAHLSWSVRGARHISIKPEIGDVLDSGRLTVMPSKTTSYTLIARTGAHRVSAVLTIEVVY